MPHGLSKNIERTQGFLTYRINSFRVRAVRKLGLQYFGVFLKGLKTVKAYNKSSRSGTHTWQVQLIIILTSQV